MRDRETLERVERMVSEYRGWELYRAEALESLARKEESVNRLMHRTRTPVDPLEIEYFRGFRQGLMYALDGLPNELLVLLRKERSADNKERDSQ